MFFFDNIFAAAYKFSSEFENDPVKTRATAIVSLSECLASAMLFSFCFRMHWLKNFSHSIPLPQIGVFIILILFGINYYYYSNDRIKRIMARFEQKPKFEVVLWNIITILSILGPFIYVATNAENL